MGDVKMMLEGLKESGKVDEFDRLRDRDFVGFDLGPATAEELWRAARHLRGDIDDAARALGAVMDQIEEMGQTVPAAA